ncbi:hypothetical protein M408DRAFT_79768 [Serendipita vermifera MAFF 305830]|uniref:Nephrocystin 3-like N-terminal domain-containing protein n=1 Tax=Serendipita vermifera MAFF 305830 TaxID=933852 RepID=A0A0C3ARQ4_SERVB|nr:hypothetical protein M408DRAFT_79768 [Serendipita vermifera MAFF 305830]
MKPSNLECGSHVAECMQGTRKKILAEMHSWMEDFDAPNILWLKGYPGVGKSAVASSFVEQLRSLKRLGSNFFFRREKANDMTPNSLWRVVAYDLSKQYSPIKEKVVAALRADETISTTINVDRLFRQLIHDPLIASEKILIGAPPVVVIDALDECGGLDRQHSEHRRNLLQTLKSWSCLPRQFKLFVTSRDESDINQLFSTTSHHLVELFAGQPGKLQSSEDISAFLKDRFRKIAMKYPRSLPPDWPGHQVVEELTTMAQGLFIWVRVITDFADRGDPEDQLDQILSGGGASDMNKLYSLILNTSFPIQNEKLIQCFRSILGAVILAKVPLTAPTLQNLLSLNATTMEHICNGLHAILDSRDTLRIHHQSFVDFLMDQNKCPSSFLIDRTRESLLLTTACLRTMKDHLRFNICNFETSYVRNGDIQNIKTRIEENIPHYLSYSSFFWASHLEEVPFNLEIMNRLNDFVSKQFLYWLEILSLMKQVNIASGRLWILVNYLQVGGCQTDVLARDMQKFVATFGSIISQSVPHIYLSALPFAPRNSSLSKNYIKYYPQTLAVQAGGQNEWPVVQNVLLGHKGWVNAVSFSPDGRRIVSGSGDTTIRIWDAETGEMVTKPLKGHDWAVNSVEFSHDGRRIVSGSDDGTIRVWDAETGELVSGPVIGHKGPVLSVRFSPDGRRVIFSSSDIAIQTWDTKTGEIIARPLKGHEQAIHSVDFSPDGRRIVSGSDDKTIRVWDVETGDVIVGPLVGHNDHIRSVTFSSDGQRIVSGSYDKTVRVWDAKTGDMVVGPLKGHNLSVQSVGISPDGRRIVSSSSDKTILVWDAQTGDLVAGPLTGHSFPVHSVRFSPDGRRIVSGSHDCTIRLWDAEMGEVVAGPFNGHERAVNSVDFSHDGGKIVSGSDDRTIRVRNAETGDPVAGPFVGHNAHVHSVGFSPDSRRIVSSSYDATIRVWDAETGKTVAGPLKEHERAVNSVNFSPDGRRIASGSDDKTIRVWDAETGEVVTGPLKGHSGYVLSIRFSPDGRQIVSGSSDKSIQIWDADTGDLIAGPFSGHHDYVRSVDYSPDGQRIVSGSDDKTIRVWDAKTGEMVAGPLKGHILPVLSVKFSPDGRRIVSGSYDGTLLVWDAETGAMITRMLRGHGGLVSSVAFSPDGRRIVSSSSDSVIRVYNAPLASTAPCFDNSSVIEEGWVLGANSELLFWVPPDLRAGLYRPGNTLVIGPIRTTILDLKAFVHGESWVQCRSKDDP